MVFRPGNDLGQKFQPGESGNPKGNYKGTPHISTQIQSMLNDPEFEMYLSDPREGFVLYKGAPIRAIINTTVKIAADKGKEAPAAREWLAKYGYGQKLEIEHSGEIATKSLSQEELDTRIREYLDRKSTT